MEIKKRYYKSFSTLLIILALTLGYNANAKQKASITIPATNALSISTSSVTLTGWNWFSNLFSNRCGRCGRRHSGRCSTGGDIYNNNHDGDNHTRCRKCRRRHSGSRCGTKPPTDSIPVDGGLGILILGAAALGIRKLRNKNRK